MATIVLSAVGASIGSGFGGAVLGLSGAVIGRAVGATLGRVIDQRLLGVGSDVIETGKVERFRLTGASEGAPVPQIYGRGRVAGQVIWATRFQEDVTTSGGGKGAPKPKTVEYSYSVSLAIALCEGEITRVGRVWADGIEVQRDSLELRVYTGSETQMPDPKIEAVEGVGLAPAYRGIAYVVIEDLPLAPYGNRVPQFTFEVQRPAQGEFQDDVPDLVRGVQAVALIPGTGEYELATSPVHYTEGPGENRSANINTPSGKTDMATSLEVLREELPRSGSVSLVVSWFGNDLRCGQCLLEPMVEQTEFDGVGMPWRVSGLTRSNAKLVPRADGRPVYGGTPDDRSVIEAIQAIRGGGQEVVFYPFILMAQQPGNGLRNPWDGADDQPTMPWRGRVTLNDAPGQAGSTDRTAAAEAEVDAFFGTASLSDFSISGGVVNYSGPTEWRYRRFILHCAHLAAIAGGVDCFCIGSEMRSLTSIRGAGDSFPAVDRLRILAAEVRQILGAGCKITYAADWSEYFGHNDGAGNRYFHLDPLWADPNIDLIGIDNYMPLSDWRDGDDHADAHWGAIYDLDYLKSNVAGGEGYDWYYTSPEAREAQIRTPITDGDYGEPWVWRYKDLRGWWLNEHYDRLNGVRQGTPTAWKPQSKPIWFTELGCAAIDKGTNQPNKFLDLRSSESRLPRYSNGTRDDLIQMQYLRAMVSYWEDPANNPISTEYTGRMIDMSKAHVWAWDARPFPYFPNNLELWSDGASYRRGHWITGRASGQPLASVVAEICERSGLKAFDVSKLYGYVRGYLVENVGPARAALQPLMLAYGFEAIEREGCLFFRMRNRRDIAVLSRDEMAAPDRDGAIIETQRAAEAETAGRVRLGFIEAEGDYETRAAEAVFPDEESFSVSQSEFPLVITQGEGQAIVERWLAEARVARDSARFSLPPSKMPLGAGDMVRFAGDPGKTLYRIDSVEQAGPLNIEAVRVEPTVYQKSDTVEERVVPRPFTPPVPTHPVFLDLPLLTGDEVPHTPYLAVAAKPWPGAVAVYSAPEDAGYELNRLIRAPAAVGVTQTAMQAAESGRWDRGASLRVRMFGGGLSSASVDAVLNGANVLAIGDGSPSNWEVFQFVDAQLVAPGTYDLSHRLRGQLGTDAIIPASWPVGSTVVVLNKAVQQINLAGRDRGLARHYRIGAALRGYDDPSYVHRIEAFDGIGLRPYSPCHLRRWVIGSEAHYRWVRRTRIEGDSWNLPDVPLGEDREQYHLRVISGGEIRREETLSEPRWSYSAAARSEDGVGATFRVEVAQISDRFGPGPYVGVDLTI